MSKKNNLDDYVNDKLESFIDKKNNRQPQFSIGSYRCSVIPNCIRKTWYDYNSPPIELSSYAKRIFEAGNAVHSSMEHVFKETSESAMTEVAFVKDLSKDIRITGTADCVFKERDKTIVAEFKSTKSLWKFNESAETYSLNCPSPLHLDQLQLYVGFLDADSGILIYVEKNTFKTKAFEVKRDKSIFNLHLSRIKELDKCLRSDKLPRAESIELKKHSECKWCRHKAKCKDDAVI